MMNPYPTTAPRKGFFMSGGFLLSLGFRSYMYLLRPGINTVRAKSCYRRMAVVVVDPASPQGRRPGKFMRAGTCRAGRSHRIALSSADEGSL